MIYRKKGAASQEYAYLDLERFLLNEGFCVTIATILSFTRVSGDVTLGTGDRAPAIVDGNKVRYWLEGGTAGTKSVFSVLVELSNTEQFGAEIEIEVRRSSW